MLLKKFINFKFEIIRCLNYNYKLKTNAKECWRWYPDHGLREAGLSLLNHVFLDKLKILLIMKISYQEHKVYPR